MADEDRANADSTRPSRHGESGPLRRMRPGRGRIGARVLVFWRVREDVVRAVLPEGVQPLRVHGSALVLAAYTRMAGKSGRWIARQLGAPVEQLSWRVPVEFPLADTPGTRRGTWVARRATNSWIEARFGDRLLGGTYRRARFALEEDQGELSLRVQGDEGLELYLRAGLGVALPVGSCFRDRREVEELLRNAGPVRPADRLAREADALVPRRAAALSAEPLVVHELRAPWVGSDGPLAGRATFDSAFRLLARRLEPVQSPAAARTRFEPRLGGAGLPAV